MSECLSHAALEGYSAGTLSPEEKMAADEHLAACGRCRDQLASLETKATLPAPPAAPDAAVHPARAIFGPLLVGFVGTGFVGLVVCLHATSQLLANVETTYDGFPSLPKPSLARRLEIPPDLLGLLYVLGVSVFFGMGLFTALLARPRNRWEDVRAGLFTGLAATLAFIPIVSWATVLASTTVPSIPDLTLVGELGNFSVDAEVPEELRPHPSEVLLEKYPDLEKEPAAERAGKFWPKIVADQVVGSFQGVWTGWILSLASAATLGLVGTMAAGYLLRRGDAFRAMIFPYLELTLPFSSLVSALVLQLTEAFSSEFFLPSLLLPLALFTAFAIPAAIYRWRLMLRLSIYAIFYGVFWPPPMSLSAWWVFMGLSVFCAYTMAVRCLQDRFSGSRWPIGWAGVGMALVVVGFLAGKSYQKQLEFDNQTIHVLVAKNALPAGTVLQLEMFDIKELPQAETTGSAVAPEQLQEGSKLQKALAAKQTLTQDAFWSQEPVTGPAQGSGLAAELPAGKRAVTCKVNIETGMAGHITKGCTVDLIFCTLDKQQTCQYLLTNVRVLPFQESRLWLPHLKPKALVTLELTPGQALALAAALGKGRLRFVLRAYGDRTALKLPVMPSPRIASLPPPAPGPISDSDLPPAVRQALAGKTAPGHQTFTLRLPSDAAGGGFVLPGSRVDVLYTPAREAGSAFLLTNLAVMALGDQWESQEYSLNLTAPKTTVTLEVTAEQAALLAGANQRGQLRLALRSALDK